MRASKPTIKSVLAPKKGQTVKETKPTANGNVSLSKITQLESFLNNHYDFKMNVVTSRVEFKRKNEIDFRLLTEVELNSVYRFVSTNNINTTIGNVRTLLNSDFIKKYDPFHDYLFNLDPWDGLVDYITKLADKVTTSDQDYWRYCFKKWFVAMVASVLEENVVNHTVIVMSGAQGIGKSSFVYSLLPRELKKFIYSGNINPSAKDTAVMLAEVMIINLDELEGLNKSEISSLKEMITKLKIKIRKAYGYHAEDLIRRASFIGSVNGTNFLRDSTGSRRFLCHEVIKVDFQHSIDLDKVYAQALHLFRSDFKFHFDGEEIEEITRHNQKFQETSMEEDFILQYFEQIEVNVAQVFMNATDIMVYLSSFVKITSSNATKQNIGKALTKHGFHRVKRNGLQMYAVKLKNQITN